MNEGNEREIVLEPGDREKRRKLRWVVAAVIVVVAALGGFAWYSVCNGDIAPSDAAAKYSGMNYLPEQEVTDYIGTYREQMGLAESTDEDWATFLAAYNLTPQRLRYTTINQILKDKLVDMKADELGVSASDEEINATIDVMKDTMGLGSDEVLEQTMAAHGQTREGLREMYRKAIVERLVLSSEVETPEPTDEQVKDYMKAYDSSLEDPALKHTYCFRLVGLDEDGSREIISSVIELRNRFAEGDKTPESFASMVKEHGNDDVLVENEGANGWSADSSGYSEAYVNALSTLELGDVSDVFVDGDAYAFIWVNDAYALPTDTGEIDALDLNLMPESLLNYLKDSTAYELWQEAGQAYLDQLLEEAGVVYYPMPADVAYNVDMELADVQLEEVDEGAVAGDE